jgi:hypothetical protein
LHPLLAVTTGSKPASQPAQTLGLDDHQNGLWPEEDLGGGTLVNQRACQAIERLQQDAGARPRLATETSQLGDGGGALAPANSASKLGRTTTAWLG